MSAGMYIGMIAQIDILLKNNHVLTEIINESIIGTDSLNPYMNSEGLSQ